MRTIKFRGKQAFGGADWKYGNLCGTPFYSQIEEVIQDKQHAKTFWTPHTQVIPDTIGQFTGVLDKNGKEIYEGDILEIKDEGVVFTKVVGFNNGMFGAGNYTLAFYGEDNIEIIGNIHDNPELLKGE